MRTATTVVIIFIIIIIKYIVSKKWLDLIYNTDREGWDYTRNIGH